MTETKYTPILGNFDEDGLHVLGAEYEDPMERNPAANMQGRPRPGRLKWFFNVTGKNYGITVSVPTPFKFTAEDVEKRLNSLLPLILLTPVDDPNITNVKLMLVPLDNPGLVADVATQRIKWPIPSVPYAPNPPGSYFNCNVLVDFSHTIVN